AAGGDRPEGGGGGAEVEPRRAAVGIGDPPGTVDLDPTHEGEIDHHPAVTDAMSSRVVPTATYRHLQCLRPCKSESAHDIVRTEAAHDHRRPTIDQSVEAATSRVVR